MEFENFSVYDKKDFRTSFLARRSREESPNNAIEKPIFFEMLGDYKGMEFLDLGCGDGSFGKELLEGGAGTYTGVEGSKEMAALAEIAILGIGGTIHQLAIENFDFPEASFDIVTSRFVFHYMEDIGPLFKDIYRTLKPEGKFVFTVQHPITTSAFVSKRQGDRRSDWLVDTYFDEGERKEPWLNETIVKHHRTTESYFAALTAAGFKVEALREGKPVPGNFKSGEEYERRRRIPLMLIFSGVKDL